MDIALIRGVQGTCGLQSLLKELSCQIFEDCECRLCSVVLNKTALWLKHICEHHPERVGVLCEEQTISAPKEINMDVIFSVANS